MKKIVYAANPAPAAPTGAAGTDHLVVIENPSPPSGGGTRTRTAGSRSRKKTSSSGKKSSTHSTRSAMATQKKRSSSKKSSTRSSTRRNPAAAISSKAVDTAKEAGVIILGSAVADQGVALLNNKMLAGQSGGVRAASAVGVPGALGLLLMSKSKKKLAQGLGLGMVITSVKNGIAVGIGAVSAGAERVRDTAVRGPRRLACPGDQHGARRVVRTLPAPAPSPSATSSGSTLPAGFAVI